VTGRFADRVCVVTGAARGIGLAICERLGREGGRVAALDVSARRLEPVVAEMKAKGVEAQGYAFDVSERAAVRAEFDRIERDFGSPVSVLINNAVWARFPSLADIDEDTSRRMLAVGVEALFWTTQAVAPQMKRHGGGAIVNLTSVSASHPAKDSIVYSAVKAGVIGLTRASAMELASIGVRVNAIAPGMIGTPASIAQFDEATIATRQGQMPLGRFGRPEEIAALAAFLASDEASYLQGAIVTADGGWTVPAR
jgi:3-oxoacyl-[acyl-carrier protein] reductase